MTIRICLIDPTRERVIKEEWCDGTYREAEEYMAILNKKLSKRKNPKGYYWTITQIGI